MRSVLLSVCLLAIAAAPALAQDYGTGTTANVPFVQPGTITLDGTADEAAWEGALVIDPLANWDGAWSGHPEPDIFSEARLLYTDGALYVYVTVEDIDFLADPGRLPGEQ